MEIIENNFAHISYRYLKSGNSDHTLLFLHGFIGNSSVWDDYVEALKNKFDIILFDLAGHGKSKSPKVIEEYLFQNQTEKIIEVLNILKIKSVSIISYSMSCYLSLLIREQLKERVKAMIFISPFFMEHFSFFERFIIKFIRFMWRYRIPDKRNATGISGTVYASTTREGTLKSEDLNDGILKLINLKIPSLIIYGKKDRTLSDKIKSLFTGFETAEIKIIENRKHLFLKTEVQAVRESIKSFLCSSPHP